MEEDRTTRLKEGVYLTRLSHQSPMNYLVECSCLGQINFYSVEASIFGGFFVPAAELHTHYMSRVEWPHLDVSGHW